VNALLRAASFALGFGQVPLSVSPVFPS